MEISGANFEALMRAMEAAVHEFTERACAEPLLWRCARPGKWSVGQHADHIAAGLTVTADSFEHSEKDLRAGVLLSPPRRWPIEALFIGIVVGMGRFPRGGKAPKSILPSSMPEPSEVVVRIARGVARHRALGERLAVDERDRLWIPSPFMRGWHYGFPEILRLHDVHTRHHTKQVTETAAKR